MFSLGRRLTMIIFTRFQKLFDDDDKWSSLLSLSSVDVGCYTVYLSNKYYHRLWHCTPLTLKFPCVFLPKKLINWKKSRQIPFSILWRFATRSSSWSKSEFSLNFSASNCCTISSLLFFQLRVDFLTDLGSFYLGKLPLMVLFPFLSHSLSLAAVIGLGSTLKILQLTHLSCFTFTVLTARQLVSDWARQDGRASSYRGYSPPSSRGEQTPASVANAKLCMLRAKIDVVGHLFKLVI